MIAFVLSGGANYGAMQAGALLALAERGIKPDIVIGTSAGALNGSQVAVDSSPENMRRIGNIWRDLSTEAIYPGGYRVALWRLARKQKALYSNDALRTFLEANLPQPNPSFAELTAARLYVTATQIPSGKLVLFGEDGADLVIDALMASAALPPLHPPYQIGENYYVDGSLATKFPLKIAVEKGAKTIYALHISHLPAEHPYEDSALALMRWSINKLLYNQDTTELNWARNQTKLNLHYLKLQAPFSLSATDFSRGDELIDVGYQIALNYLNSLPRPLTVRMQQSLQTFGQKLSAAPQQLRQRWSMQ